MNMIDKRRERTLRLVLNLKFMRRQGLRQGDEMLWGDRRASLIAFEQNSTLIAVIGMSLSSWR